MASALELDESERTHLFDLAQAANTSPRRRRSAPSNDFGWASGILDSIEAPAYVRNNRLDLLGVNRLGRALMPDVPDPASGRSNLARYMFLNPQAREFYVDWRGVAKDVVSALRIEAGRNPYDRGLTDLIGNCRLAVMISELGGPARATNSRLHRTSTKQMQHPVVGVIELTGEALELPGDPGLTIITYTVEPATPSAQALQFLSNWASENADVVESSS